MHPVKRTPSRAVPKRVKVIRCGDGARDAAAAFARALPRPAVSAGPGALVEIVKHRHRVPVARQKRVPEGLVYRVLNLPSRFVRRHCLADKFGEAAVAVFADKPEPPFVVVSSLRVSDRIRDAVPPAASFQNRRSSCRYSFNMSDVICRPLGLPSRGRGAPNLPFICQNSRGEALSVPFSDKGSVTGTLRSAPAPTPVTLPADTSSVIGGVGSCADTSGSKTTV